MLEASIPNPYTPAPLPAPADRGAPDPEETMSRDQIEALQFERLRWTLHHAYETVPAYREHFDAHGVHPSDFTELGDLAKFPYTDKEFLRKSYPFGAFAATGPELRRIHASSGTTGQPTVVGYTDDDLATWATLVARCFRAGGIRPGDRVHNAYGYGLFTGGLGAHYGAERVGAAVIPMSGGQTEKQVQLITDFQPRAILSTPTYLLTIADGFKKLGLDPRESSLEVVILGAEPWTDEMRREIEQTFDLDALDIYGLSEVMGPGVAGESAATKDGSHIWEDHFRPGDHRPAHGRGPRDRPPRRARLHLAHQAGAADHPVPHPRPHPPAAGHHAPGPPPHGPHHRPLGRHDHPARREPVPVADRGAGPQGAGPVAALHPRNHAPGPHGPDGREHRAP